MLSPTPSFATPDSSLGIVLPGVDAWRLLDQAQTGLYVVQDDHIVYANAILAELVGWPAEELIGQHHLLTMAPEFRDHARAAVLRRLEGKTGRPGQVRCLRRDGGRFDARAFARLIEFAGHPAVLVTLFDITELNAALQQARWNADMLARAESMCRSGSFEVALPEGRVTLSSGMCELVGLTGPAASDGNINTLAWVPADEQAFVAGIWRNAVPGEPFEFQHRVHGPDGRRLIVLHRGLVDGENDARPGIRGVALLQDISAQREAEMRLQELSTHDEVSGLPNRASFLDRLDAAMHSARWSSETITLLTIDVARIAEVKVKMGFGAGDTLLMAVAARLQQACREGESVAQLSDTEFALMLEGCAGVDDASVRARAVALRDVLQVPVRLAATDVYPQCVIGIASFPGDGQEPAELLECAQTARLNATGNTGIVFFKPDSGTRALREMKLESALRRALDDGELTLHYQPQVDLSNGAVVGAEALLRWTSPDLGQVSPAEFIPVAERSGLIGVLGDWVLRTACWQIATWRRAGVPAVRIGVNLSPTQLQKPDLARHIQAVLVETGADPACLGIELTEGTAMSDAAHASSVLRDIRALGIEISLDDFGTGFSSLSCLRSLPIDVVKVDRSFVHDVTAAPEDVSVTRAIITMAHGLQMRVLAEGVETEGQLSLLAANRCDLIQGVLFSPAVPADEFAQLLKEDRRLPERFVTRIRRTKTLLLVDDEENILSSLKRLLRRDGYTILTACGAAEGLQRLAETEVDVIVSDQRMPGMTGVELLRRAKELYPDSIRMVLSGYTELQSIIDAINEGAIYKFLTKPWDDERLRGHVAEAFRQKDLADENRRLASQVESANTDYIELNTRLEHLVAQQREQAELLAASAGGMREVLDSLPAPVLGIDPDGTLAFVNHAAEALLPDSICMLGQQLHDALPPDLLRAVGNTSDSARAVELAGRNFHVLTRPLKGGGAMRGQLVLLVEQPLAEIL
ncbi:MAG TPA: EAL domain-containing protein [Burkholderiaceae bacterium]|nr:EAL domain-containing protein [Burkholderiaceae bacterium]